MAFTTLQQLAASLGSNDQDYPLMYATATTVAGGFIDLNRTGIGSSFGQSGIPALRTVGGQIHTDAEAGYPTITAATGKSLYLAKASLTQTGATGVLHIYDRIWSCSGIDAVQTTVQPITGFPTLPTARAPGTGEGLEMWLECYATIGASAVTFAINYTSATGGANQVASIQTIANMPASRIVRIPLADGNSGVRSIETTQLGASTGTAGNLGLTLMKLIATIPVPYIYQTVALDYAALGLPVIQSDAALMFVYQANATPTGALLGTFSLAAG